MSLEDMEMKHGTDPDVNGLHAGLSDEYEDALEEIITTLEKNWKNGK